MTRTTIEVLLQLTSYPGDKYDNTRNTALNQQCLLSRTNEVTVSEIMRTKRTEKFGSFVPPYSLSSPFFHTKETRASFKYQYKAYK